MSIVSVESIKKKVIVVKKLKKLLIKIIYLFLVYKDYSILFAINMQLFLKIQLFQMI